MRLFQWEWSWESKPLRQPWHSILLAAFSLVLFAASGYSYFSTQQFVAESSRADGVVERMLQEGELSYPRVSFVDAGGLQHAFNSKLHSKPPRYSAGDQVSVLYKKERPDEAQIENFLELWFVALITGILGFALGTAALLIWVFRKRLFDQYGVTSGKPVKGQSRAERAAL